MDEIGCQSADKEGRRVADWVEPTAPSSQTDKGLIMPRLRSHLYIPLGEGSKHFHGYVLRLILDVINL